MSGTTTGRATTTASVSCKDSISRAFDDVARQLARNMARAPLCRTESLTTHSIRWTFIESYTEDEWDALIHRPTKWVPMHPVALAAIANAKGATV